jgi:tRNA-dihydrouridine synthase B
MFDFKKLENGAFLAPMADYTNVAFRTLCKEYGSALQYTELISCKSIIYKNKKTKKMLSISEKEKPVFLQLFGSVPENFEKAIKIIEKNYSGFAGYDLNCGCSVPKALKGKYGCYLMDYPKLVGNIIRAMKKSTKKPVSIKMRLGLEKENYLEVAREAEKAGVDSICLHARLGKQGYAGKADWEAIKKLKKKSKVSIIGNGDVNLVEDYIKMKKETKCDFVMIGRGVIGNTFLFKQIKEFEEKGLKEVPERTKEDLFDEGEKYIKLAKEFSLKVNDVRPYFIGLANGFRGAKKLRNKFAMAKSIKEIEKNFEGFFL